MSFRLKTLLKKFILLINPGILLLIMAIAIFVVESLVMLLLDALPPISRGWEAVLDSSILLLLLTPFYFYLYQPFWGERQRQERQIRNLSQKLLTTAEEERKRVAHEIHDQSGQTLTVLQFGLQTLKKKIPDYAEPALKQADHLVQVVAHLGDELRGLTVSLRPVVLDRIGLSAAIAWQIENFQDNFPEIDLRWQVFGKEDLPQPLAPEVENAVFRITQEALTNVVQHASASVVRLDLTVQNGRSLQLKIKDNGIGFELEKCLGHESGECGFGLLGMRERAFMANGKFDIKTAPGLGTCIEASFPLSGQVTL